MQELSAFASHLADEAGKIITRYFRTDFAIDTKSNETPVTVADREVELHLRKIIESARPDDGILGEETEAKESKNGFTWVLDPIDGTKSFTIGRPSFGTLIAYCKDWTPVLGVIDQPILKERWIGDGKTTTFNGTIVKTSKCDRLKDARIASTSPAQLTQLVAPPSLPPQAGGSCEAAGGSTMLWQRLYKEGRYMVWGGDCYSYGLLANGWLDAVVETMLAPYDYAALAPIVNGAGGWMGDWNGTPLTLKSDGHTLAIGDAGLKDDFLALLRG